MPAFSSASVLAHMVRWRHGEGPVANRLVEIVTGDPLAFRNDRIVGSLGEQHRSLRMAGCVIADGGGESAAAEDAGELEMIELGGTGKEVHVAFDEARQNRGPAGVENPGLGTGQPPDFRGAAERQDAIARK